MPGLVEAILKSKQQTAFVTLRYEAVATACQGHFNRLSQFRVRLHESGRWVTMGIPGWQTFYSGNRANEPVQEVFGDKGRSYECSPGKGVTTAQLQVRNQVKSLATHKVVNEKTKSWPVKVYGAC
jgi:hypothetical protein